MRRLTVALAAGASAFVAPRQRGPPPHAAVVANPLADLFKGGAGTGEKAAAKLVAAVCSPRGVDAAAVAALCADDVVYEDLASSTFEGPSAVAAYLTTKYPPSCRVVADRVGGDAVSGGFTWHREAADDPGVAGLRGTTFCRFNADGTLAYAREGSEPLLKPGEATEALLKAVTANIEKPEVVATYEARSPKGAAAVADYLWTEAYPKGATPAVALELFAEDIRYEDFNYPAPFLGKPAVKEFVEAFDIPGVEFVPLEISGGADACCFTWLVKVNGQDGPQGISFYGADASGKINYIRDIPAVAPAPLQNLAALVNPALRSFSKTPL